MSKGFIFTMDAVLALIPIFIILASVSGLNYDQEHFLSIPLEKIAQDSIEILLLGDAPMVQQYVDSNRSNSSRDTIFNALNGTITHSYMLMYNSTSTSGWEFVVGRCSSGNQSSVVSSSKDNASDVYVGERIIFRNNSRHDFRMHIWRD